MSLFSARGDVVAHARSVVTAMESERHLEHDAIAGGHALVLAEMLEPRFDDERLEPSIGLSRVLVDAPTDRSVAPPDRLQTPHGAEERILVRAIDPILECDEDRTLVAVELASDLRQRPARVGAEIEVRKPVQLEPSRDDRADDERRGTARERNGYALALGDETPQETADRQAALDREHADGERPGSYPRRHGALCGDVQRGHRGDPRDTADEERRARHDRLARDRDESGHSGEADGCE